MPEEVQTAEQHDEQASARARQIPRYVRFRCECGKQHRIPTSRFMSVIGSIKSERKKLSSRENGKRGGRPVEPTSARQQKLLAKMGQEPHRN